MADYISREAALSCFHDWIDRYGHEHSADEMTEYQRIEELPVADVRPVVRGTWVPTRKYDYYYKCSVCNKIGPLEPDAESAFQYDYCPNCGADMREPNLDTTKGERRDESSG